jgi:hypothetical protein
MTRLAMPDAAAPAGAKPEAKGKDAAAEPIPRKIIYTANVSLVVADFAKAEQELLQLVQDNGGYIARSDSRDYPGAPRSGTWTIRVPVDRLESFQDAVAQLGELQRRQLDSEDITDQYYDTAARLRTYQAEEQNLLRLLDKVTGKDEYLALRQELRQVRSEIESMQGRLQRWDKLVALATVVVNLQERTGFVPASAPGFGTTMGRTFYDSVTALVTFGKFVVLVVVALVPWLPLLAVGIGLPWWWLRRLIRRHRQRSAVLLEVQPTAAPPTEPAG